MTDEQAIKKAIKALDYLLQKDFENKDFEHNLIDWYLITDAYLNLKKCIKLSNTTKK